MRKGKNLIALVIIIILSVSCNKEEKVILMGKLGEHESKITLHQKGDKFSGTFKYIDKSISAKSIDLRGTRIGRNLRLEEFNNNENKLTGIFDGEFDGSSFIGYWNAPTGKEKVPFSFSKNITKPDSTSSEASTKIQYVLIDHPDGILAHQGISAKLNNKTYELIRPVANNLRCIDIYKIDDFNGDGFEDVLLTDIVACGGNCCPNEYFFCSYSKEQDKFIATENFGASWGDPIIENRSGKFSIKLVDNTQGAGYTEMKEVTSWSILEGNNVKILESIERKEIDAIKEIRASNLNEYEEEEGAKLEFDLNKDGKIDEIRAEYWMRWGTLNWEVNLSNVNSPVLIGGGKRIGILSTLTNGVHDLVNSFDEIYIWNGNKYELKK